MKAEGQLRIVAAWQNSIEAKPYSNCYIVDNNCDTRNETEMDYKLMNNDKL